MTRPNQEDVLGAIITTLQDIVAPEVTTLYAKAHLRTVIYALRRIRNRKSTSQADAVRRIHAARSFLSLAANLGIPQPFHPDDEHSTLGDFQMAMDRSPDEIEQIEDHLMDQVADLVNLVNSNPSLHRDMEARLAEFLLEYTSIDV